MSDWVWVVAGGPLQRPLVEAYIERGYHVLITDQDLNCACHDIADIIPISTIDLGGHLTAARQCISPPKAVMTAGTDVGHTVSLVAGAFGLPGAPFVVADQLRNKGMLRAVLDDDHPWWRVGPDRVKRPCVVKPVDLSGSRGVTKCETQEQVKRAWEKAAEMSSINVAIVEELLSGPVAAADYLVVDGQAVYVNGALRTFDPDRFGLETGYSNPWREKDVDVLAQRIVTAFDLREGPFKIDVICDPRYGWLPLEAATRWSGAFDHTVAATLSTGRDLTSILVDYSLDLDPYIPRVPDDAKTVHVTTPRFPPGTYTKPLIDAYLGCPGVLAVRTTRDMTPTDYETSHRAVFVFGESREALTVATTAVLTWNALQLTGGMN